MLTLYGLPTCDTCRKALNALKDAGRAPVLRDVRKEPLNAQEIARFLDAFGDRLINRSSTTWRGLTEADRTLTPAELLAAHPTLMKRPVIEGDGKSTLGWDKPTQAAWL